MGGGVGGRVRKPTIAPRNGKLALTAGCRRSVPLCVKDTLLALSISLLREAAGIWGNTHSCSWEPSLKQEDIKGSAERETQTQRMGWVPVSLQRGLEFKASLCLQKKTTGDLESVGNCTTFLSTLSSVSVEMEKHKSTSSV